MIMVDFGTRLKELRKSAGLTQKQLADRLGITASVVSYYELSERTPSPEVLVKLAGIFHVSVDDMLGITRPQPFPLDTSGLTEADLRFLQQTIDYLRQKNM